MFERNREQVDLITSNKSFSNRIAKKEPKKNHKREKVCCPSPRNENRKEPHSLAQEMKEEKNLTIQLAMLIIGSIMIIKHFNSGSTSSHE